MSEQPGTGMPLVQGRYRLLEPLGVGGSGTVWRGVDEVLGRPVAVKQVLLPPGLPEAERELLRERTRREARASARIDHPAAVRVYDVVEEAGAPYLVLELVDARPLSQVVTGDGPLTPRRTAQIGLALLGALEAAHARGILHRDVKPGNVLLGPPVDGDAGRVVLTDFGIASVEGDTSITGTGLLLGSPAYIAPERARGQAPGAASDLWSLGATLFTAVEGRPPYAGEDPVQTVTAVVTGEHEPFRLAGPLAGVLEALLEREPARRPSIGEVRSALLPVSRADRTGTLAARGVDVLPARPARPAPAVLSAVGGPPREARRRAAVVEDTSELDLAEVGVAVRHAGQRAGGSASGIGTVDSGAPPAPPAASGGWDFMAGGDGPPESARRRAPSGGRLGVLMLLVIALASGAAYLLVGGSDTESLASSPSSSPSAPASAAPSPSSSPAGSALPAGWKRYTDPTDGWSVGVPPTYVYKPFNGKVQLRDGDTRYTLRVDIVSPEGGALASSEAYGRALAGALGARGYRELSQGAAQGVGATAGDDVADLAFTYSDRGADLRVLNRTIVPAGGPAYRVYWQVNERDWEDARPVLDGVLRTFSPAG